MFRNYNYISSILFQLVKTLVKNLTLPYDWIRHKIVNKRIEKSFLIFLSGFKNVIRISFCRKMFLILYLMAYHLEMIANCLRSPALKTMAAE